MNNWNDLCAILCFEWLEPKQLDAFTQSNLYAHGITIEFEINLPIQPQQQVGHNHTNRTNLARS